MEPIDYALNQNIFSTKISGYDLTFVAEHINKGRNSI
jgi:hypothetical protein|tara:strand:+ start:626 stop:736 length:111 start_codon:yes stop_codon:yes gene_type:complete